MYKKLVLENHGKPFEIVYGGNTHEIPSGKFEAELDLGNFIFQKARSFGFKVNKVGHPEDPKVEAIIPEKVEEKEETKTEVKSKPKK